MHTKHHLSSPATVREVRSGKSMNRPMTSDGQPMTSDGQAFRPNSASLSINVANILLNLGNPSLSYICKICRVPRLLCCAAFMMLGYALFSYCPTISYLATYSPDYKCHQVSKIIEDQNASLWASRGHIRQLGNVAKLLLAYSTSLCRCFAVPHNVRYIP